MTKEARKRKIAMIGRGNLDIWPWTAERTKMMIFLSIIGVLMIILGAVLPAVRVPLLFFGITIVFTTVLGGISGFVEDELPNRVIIGTIKLDIVKYIPLTHPTVRVVGNNGDEYSLSPSTILPSGETKSSVTIHGRLKHPTIYLFLGQDYKDIISLA